MKAIILAAGYGKRLLPLTRHTPKPLLQVYGSTLIEHHIVKLVRIGVRDIVINLGYLGYKIKHYLGSGERYGARFFYSEEGTPPLETAGGIRHALHLLIGEPTFLVINADIYTDYPLENLLQHAQQYRTSGHIVLAPLSTVGGSKLEQGDFSLDQWGMVTLAAHNPYVFTGISYLSTQWFTQMPYGNRKLKQILLERIWTGQLSGEVYRGEWCDLGTMAALKSYCARDAFQVFKRLNPRSVQH